jgi:hypothetical protein
MAESSITIDKNRLVQMGFRLKPVDSATRPGDVNTNQPPDNPQGALWAIGEQFTTKLLLLWTYMNEIRRVADATAFTNMAGALALVVEVIDTAKNPPTGATALAEVEFDIFAESPETGKHRLRVTEKVYDPKHLRSLREYQRLHDAGLRILHESALQQVVNAYERLIGDLIRWHLNYDPAAAPKNQTLTYQELLQFESIEEAQRRVVQSFLSEFLRTKTAPQQLDYFREHFNADVKAHFPKLAEFEEIVLRRHTIVHAGGVVTPEYLRRVRSLGNLPFKAGEEGAVIELTTEYIQSAWCIVYALGTILLHQIGRQSARDRKKKEEEEQADLFVVMYPFKALQEKIYEAADVILNYATKLRLATNTHDLMVKINLAQTLKWQHREEDMRNLLDPIDWKATSNRFRACAAALRNPDEFGELLSAAVRDKELSLEELYEWPVFSEVRTHSKFPEWVQAAFGGSTSPAHQTFVPSPINVNHKAVLADLLAGISRRGGLVFQSISDADSGSAPVQNNGKPEDEKSPS